MDPYKVLGVNPDASDEEIKKAYRTLTKKYHPDLNPNDPNAEKKYAEINAAYDAITKGNASSYSNPYSQSGQGYSSGSSWGSWQQQYWQQQSQQNQRDNMRSEYRAAVNYIRNGMYKEAINSLNQVPVSERDAEWYYLMAGANMYIGNKVAALEYAKRACEIEPDNEEYQRLLKTLQAGGNYYDTYTVNYNKGLDPTKLCLTLCAINACLGGSFPGFFCCC